jgi:hypothetical protein
MTRNGRVGTFASLLFWPCCCDTSVSVARSRVPRFTQVTYIYVRDNLGCFLQPLARRERNLDEPRNREAIR